MLHYMSLLEDQINSLQFSIYMNLVFDSCTIADVKLMFWLSAL